MYNIHINTTNNNSTEENTPTLDVPLPGIWTFENACVLYCPIDKDGLTVRWCVESIEVQDDGEMWVNAAWTVELTYSWYSLTEKHTDAGRMMMYLTDNLDNRYDSIDLGGAAKDQTRVGNGGTLRGWYLFPPAKPGAYMFTFHDDDQCMHDQPCLIENLVLDNNHRQK